MTEPITRHPRLPKGVIVFLLLFLTLSAHARTAEPKTPAKKSPPPMTAAPISLGQNLTGADLKRIQVGLQAGLLKIFAPDGITVSFLKTGPCSPGIDGRELAPLSASQRDTILQALGVEDPGALTDSLLATYGKVPRPQAIALLGVLAHPGVETPPITPELSARVLERLRTSLQPEENNVARRQAVLALAIQPATDEVTVKAMVEYLKRDHNAWNTFGVVQFFDLHSEQIRSMPFCSSLAEELTASGNPHSAQILGNLDPDPTTMVAIPAGTQ